jgi:hypothetical protein
MSLVVVPVSVLFIAGNAFPVDFAVASAGGSSDAAL